MNTTGESKRDQQDSARWDAAEKLPLDSIPKEMLPRGCNLWLYSERVDEFFSEVESLVESHEEAGVPLDRVYLCRDDPGNPPDAAVVIESCCEGMFEDAYEHISAEASDELQRFLTEWWKKNCPPGVVPSKVGVLIPSSTASGKGVA